MWKTGCPSVAVVVLPETEVLEEVLEVSKTNNSTQITVARNRGHSFQILRTTKGKGLLALYSARFIMSHRFWWTCSGILYYRVVHDLAPVCLNLCHLQVQQASSISPHPCLTVPRIWLERLGSRSFSVAGPSTLDALPLSPYSGDASWFLVKGNYFGKIWCNNIVDTPLLV